MLPPPIPHTIPIPRQRVCPINGLNKNTITLKTNMKHGCMDTLQHGFAQNSFPKKTIWSSKGPDAQRATRSDLERDWVGLRTKEKQNKNGKERRKKPEKEKTPPKHGASDRSIRWAVRQGLEELLPILRGVPEAVEAEDGALEAKPGDPQLRSVAPSPILFPTFWLGPIFVGCHPNKGKTQSFLSQHSMGLCTSSFGERRLSSWKRGLVHKTPGEGWLGSSDPGNKS